MAIGTFDGVHVGHRAVVAGAETVVTFDPHPRSLVRAHGTAPPLLTSIDEKARRLAELDVREMVIVPFNKAIASMPARTFIERVLVERLGVRRIAIGANFRFGQAASGDPELLRNDERLATDVVPLVHHLGEPVSSSRIRRLLADGAVEEAAVLLGRPHVVAGSIGRRLADGRMTIQIAEHAALPARGSYRCRIDTKTYVVEILDRPVRTAAAAAFEAPGRFAPGTPVRLELVGRAAGSADRSP